MKLTNFVKKKTKNDYSQKKNSNAVVTSYKYLLKHTFIFNNTFILNKINSEYIICNEKIINKQFI